MTVLGRVARIVGADFFVRKFGKQRNAGYAHAKQPHAVPVSRELPRRRIAFLDVEAMTVVARAHHQKHVLAGLARELFHQRVAQLHERRRLHRRRAQRHAFHTEAIKPGLRIARGKAGFDQRRGDAVGRGSIEPGRVRHRLQ